MVRAAWLLRRERSSESSVFQRNLAASISNVSITWWQQMPAMQHVTQLKWAEAAMHQCLHIQTHILRSVTYSSLHIAWCLICAWVPYAQSTQLVNEGPTQALCFAKGLADATVPFFFHSCGKQPTQLALYFVGMFADTSYTGVQVLLWAVRKN